MQRSNRRLVWTGLVVAAAAGLLTLAYQHRDQSSAKEPVTAVGSTALQPLVEAAGEDFQKNHAGTFVNVQGGGTGTGLSQVAQGAVSIGDSDLFAEEKKGIDPSELVDHKIAVVGITPILNKEAGVSNLSLSDLTKIFTGKITNWKEVGGADQKIVLVNRAAGSGTRAAFEKWAMGGQKSKASQEQDSSGMVKSIVKSTPGAISYVSFAYADADLMTPTIDGVKPTDAAVATGRYPIWSYEHMYTKGQAQGDTKKFLDYMYSERVQQTLVPKLGYISIHDMKINRDRDGHVTQLSATGE
ncbi:phosphate ABC transporter substrate-binding protein PstS family protein [Leuconostocaceae bacterium ESL0958]|nr:phosphate ABC transporter substrate-binding protein PstS family protein [Leuconostocaceae bacterium ESL0958]